MKPHSDTVKMHLDCILHNVWGSSGLYTTTRVPSCGGVRPAGWACESNIGVHSVYIWRWGTLARLCRRRVKFIQHQVQTIVLQLQGWECCFCCFCYGVDSWWEMVCHVRLGNEDGVRWEEWQCEKVSKCVASCLVLPALADPHQETGGCKAA